MAYPLVSLSPQLIPQFMTSAGAPASGYLLQTYAAGTTTPLATYTDSTGATANTNPIVLNANGNPQTGGSVTCGIWLVEGLSYKVQLQTSTGSPVWTLDNIAATGPFQYYAGASTGSANAYAIANPQITAYGTPFEVTFIANFANTGAATLNINGLGNKNIYRVTIAGPAALLGNEIQNGQVVTVVYDGTEFQLVSDAAVVSATNIVGPVALTYVSNVLATSVALSNVTTFFDGPSVSSSASGTWYVSGSITMQDASVAATFYAKLWDGTTVIDSGRSNTYTSGAYTVVALSGVITSPVGNLRISANDPTSTSGVIVTNATGLSKDSAITAVRIG